MGRCHTTSESPLTSRTMGEARKQRWPTKARHARHKVAWLCAKNAKERNNLCDDGGYQKTQRKHPTCRQRIFKLTARSACMPASLPAGSQRPSSNARCKGKEQFRASVVPVHS
eukprot:TRINITY_DN5999_c0_g2_i1.p1 TRINITY_DN5999_c0_g2~~TRINITY_DN5999_c0_g2_i1.p1  ORF type:complete len:123 (+),score=0.61 TRINITY_DN5999_c0_g2_i1:32-370(+)